MSNTRAFSFKNNVVGSVDSVNSVNLTAMHMMHVVCEDMHAHAEREQEHAHYELSEKMI